MAFDQPLEADKVDDNLFLSIVRGPILGGLLWILGEDDNEKRRAMELQQKLQDMALNDNGDKNNEHQRNLPRLVHSDLSVAEQDPPPETYFLGRQRTEKKKMSWSENLVEYMDEVRQKKIETSVCFLVCVLYWILWLGPSIFGGLRPPHLHPVWMLV
jgi:hypothetical protein